MAYIVDSVFGDGAPSQDASDPLSTFGRFLNAGTNIAAGLTIAEVGADMSGGVSLEAPAPEINGLKLGIDNSPGITTAPTPGGMMG